MVWEPKKYLKIFFYLRHVNKIAAHFKKKNKQTSRIFIKVSKQRKWKNLKKRGCRNIFRTLPNIYDGEFLQRYKRLKASSLMFDRVLNMPLRLHKILKSI